MNTKHWTTIIHCNQENPYYFDFFSFNLRNYNWIFCRIEKCSSLSDFEPFLAIKNSNVSDFYLLKIKSNSIHFYIKNSNPNWIFILKNKNLFKNLKIFIYFKLKFIWKNDFFRKSNNLSNLKSNQSNYNFPFEISYIKNPSKRYSSFHFNWNNSIEFIEYCTHLPYCLWIYYNLVVMPFWQLYVNWTHFVF